MRHSTRDHYLGVIPLAAEFFYYRFSFQPACDVQLLATPEHELNAFVIHGCGYSFPGQTWKVGISTFSELGQVTDSSVRFIGGDGKGPAYVEKFYFGRAGHYHDFYFSGWSKDLRFDDASLNEVDRNSVLLAAVAVVRTPASLSEVQQKSWDDFFGNIAGVQVLRFEEF